MYCDFENNALSRILLAGKSRDEKCKNYQIAEKCLTKREKSGILIKL